MSEASESAKGTGGGQAVDASALLGASRAEADAYLRKQREYLDLQIEDLKREDAIHHWSLRVRHISDVMKLSFELAAAGVVTAIVIFIGAAVWSAVHDRALVIEAFNVPTDMAAQGLTGQVVATQLQDRLTWMQSKTDTIRQANTFRNNWGDDIKVQIPNTGVSIGDFYRYLAGWLGNETHITGEVWRMSGGIALTVRSGAETGQRFFSRDGDLDALIGYAADHVYETTQPYRFAVYLAPIGWTPRALAVVQSLALNGPPEEKPWAYTYWGLLLQGQGRLQESAQKERIAARLDPNLPNALLNLGAGEAWLGHDEAQFAANRRGFLACHGPEAQSLAPYAVAIQTHASAMHIAEALGDYQSALTQTPIILSLRDYVGAHRSTTVMAESDYASAHDPEGSMRAGDGDLKSDSAILHFAMFSSNDLDLPALPFLMRAIARGQWKDARDDLEALVNSPDAKDPAEKDLVPVLLLPWLAFSDAGLGDFPAAHTWIDRTPLDCYSCVRMRGNIDAAQKNWNGAAYWFADATKQAPSLPFAETDWGAMLLDKRNYADAIAKFERAHQKGPHFADPLEMWGEALMAENRSDLALAKFAEAAKYAPNWGRLHLKWGEALLWSGDKAGAQKQFAIAARLFLTPAEKGQLMRLFQG